MGMTEVILLVVGGVLFAASFFLPSGKRGSAGKEQESEEKRFKEMTAGELAQIKEKISGMMDETLDYSSEKAERAMERISNEKIMAVGEYADTVLEQINKNHNEVVFLYDMLNEKYESLKNTVSEAAKAEAKIRQLLTDAEVSAKEAEETGRGMTAAAEETTAAVRQAEETVAGLTEEINRLKRTLEETGEKAKKRAAGRSLAAKPEGKASAREDEPEAGKLGEFVPLGDSAVYVDLSAGAGNRKKESRLSGETEEAEKKPQKPSGAKTRKRDSEKLTEEKAAEPMERDTGSSTGEKAVKQTEAGASGESSGKRDEVNTPEGETGVRAKGRTARQGTGKKAGEQQNEKTPAEKGQQNIGAGVKAGKLEGNSNDRILELHRAGKSNISIARELGLGVGEVKLVIDLFDEG